MFDKPKAAWLIVYDGPSRPMIMTDDGRLLSISQFKDGKWQSYDKEVQDCETICQGIKWLMECE